MPDQGAHGHPERDAIAISPTYWDFGDEREDSIHRIHAYPAKFPAFITTKALRYAQRNGVTVDLVAEFLCFFVVAAPPQWRHYETEKASGVAISTLSPRLLRM